MGLGLAGLGVGARLDWKAVKGLGWAAGRGVGASGLGLAPAAGAASSLTRTSSPLGRACLSSVLKVPEAGSKTNSVEKLGPAGWGAASSALFLSCSRASSKVMAGLPKVKLSKAESKSKAEGRAVGLGVAGCGLGLVTAGASVGLGLRAGWTGAAS